VESVLSEGGHLDEARVKMFGDRPVYFLELERPMFRDLEAFVDGEGVVLARRDELEAEALPPAVRDAAAVKVPEGATIDDVMRQEMNGSVRFVLELDREGAPDLHLHFSENGQEIERFAEIDDWPNGFDLARARS
jgi:hypothetical protein